MVESNWPSKSPQLSVSYFILTYQHTGKQIVIGPMVADLDGCVESRNQVNPKVGNLQCLETSFLSMRLKINMDFACPADR